TGLPTFTTMNGSTRHSRASPAFLALVWAGADAVGAALGAAGSGPWADAASGRHAAANTASVSFFIRGCLRKRGSCPSADPSSRVLSGHWNANAPHSAAPGESPSTRALRHA